MRVSAWWLVTLAVAWPVDAEAQLSWAGPDIDRAAADGRLCFESDDGKTRTALPFKGKGLAGEPVKACDVKLQPGLPGGVKLVLRARKPARRVTITVDGDGRAVVSRLGSDGKRWERRARRLLGRRGLSLFLQQGRRRTLVARFRRGYVQYFLLYL